MVKKKKIGPFSLISELVQYPENSAFNENLYVCNNFNVFSLFTILFFFNNKTMEH